MSWLKDPVEVLDYLFEWGSLLEEAETLISKTVVAPDGITVDSSLIAGTGVVVWLSGGSIGKTYRIDCTVVTSGGRTLRRGREIRIGRH